MTMARAHLIDPSVSRWYHCIIRCVRRAFLLGEGESDRKTWIENRIRELAQIFSVSVGGYSILDNHVHLLVRIDPEVAAGWSDEDVVRRWGRLFPPRTVSRQPLEVSKQWVQQKLDEPGWVAAARERLQSLSWFMKCLKEPLSRMANREDQTRGVFFEGRFKSVALLDEEALLATCVYIDLNPVAAGIAKVPEKSAHTTIKERVDHVKAQGRVDDLKAARAGSAAGSKACAGLEEKHWLCPIEDRRRLDSKREGMIEGFSLGSYVLLVDFTGRLFRAGKVTISREASEIFQRLGTTPESWGARLEKLRGKHLFSQIGRGQEAGRDLRRPKEKYNAVLTLRSIPENP